MHCTNCLDLLKRTNRNASFCNNERLIRKKTRMKNIEIVQVRSASKWASNYT